MFARNRVIWNEGLFIKPQHFQQQQRFLEYHIDERILSVSRYLHGVSELSLNPEYLSFGRIAIERAVGIMPDGTVFRIPQEDVLPDALEIEDASLANQLVYLAIPLRSDSLMEINWPEERGTGRFVSSRLEVRDVHTVRGDTTTLDVSPVRVQLMLEKEDRSSYASIAVARIMEKRPDGSIVLDPDFIPCHINVASNPSLHRFINEISGLMRERAKNIAQRISAPSQGGVADVSDFMLLQALNRLQPQMQHLAELRSLHPERLFECLASVCGELATFTDESRLPPTIPSYNHEMPSQSFQPLIRSLRQSLSIVLEPRAVSIQLDKRKYGLMVAPIHDPQLIESAEFIIAVKARMPLDELRRLFTQQTKVSSVEKIRELISLQLPGIPITALPVAPRQLPYHAGYTYYQLDKTSSAWAMLAHSSGFAFHVAGAFDDLDLQFWAIRN
ncbi:type VI secretion system baseplate subunit TssK [Vibrio metschnikovii]|uniref:Type VI secretion system baseplate subunit TssK n=3 Tax=Bacteria TaxID=2 RepID=A0AAU6UTN6_UNCXX|nr:type VI secretion system baseplate subunit TssK [Vibrio metschnikovii]EKO3590712.1 type VI secretion system baseplate subunit TssK [Vibrio metschnikovii]EKO3594117.1 type VI secretion system baseplate subunit TssK [Vibrio metschnikovii]EKO3600993.1 type VI secretion system baseplate subunit TssK [Vibrio metschnikovii]EKO3626160.1 type VI secretion system baseplate subunit TssK [Vibrio metschnikovii]EKO3643115.1 type VI secretion system baseplate subunit TssK [Vibrio metschnikovii]